MEISLGQKSAFGAEPRLLFELEKFKSVMGPRGINIRTHGPRSLQRLRAMTEEQRTKILDGFRNYTDLICTIVEANSEALSSEEILFRGVVERLRLVVDEDLFRTLREDQDTVVEVYNQDFVQIYRSPKFMEMCNYTLLDLLTHEFYELFERSASLTDHLIRFTEIVRRRATVESVDLTVDIPKHLMREKFAEERGVFEIEFRRMYPLYRWPKDFYGFVMTSKGRPYLDRSVADAIAFI